MTQFRWAVVPACVTFGPLFIFMGLTGGPPLLVAGAMMTIAGLGILIHGIATRQLPPGPPPSRDYLSGVVSGIGIGCLIISAFLRDLSTDTIMYAGIALLIAASFLRPRERRSPNSVGTA